MTLTKKLCVHQNALNPFYLNSKCWPLRFANVLCSKCTTKMYPLKSISKCTRVFVLIQPLLLLACICCAFQCLQCMNKWIENCSDVVPALITSHRIADIFRFWDPCNFVSCITTISQLISTNWLPICTKTSGSNRRTPMYTIFDRM